VVDAVWVLTAYDKRSDEFIDEWALPDVTLEELREIFDLPDDPMVDVYPVTREHAAQLHSRVDHQIDLDAYDYFVEGRAPFRRAD
jgi:hypothetical protein